MDYLFFVLVLAAAMSAIWCLAWFISDTQKRGQTGADVLARMAVNPLFTLVDWFANRPPTLVETPPHSYGNPVEALAAAARLDSFGEWDMATKVYTYVANRWPAHREYCDNCIESIRDKQSMGASDHGMAETG